MITIATLFSDVLELNTINLISFQDVLTNEQTQKNIHLCDEIKKLEIKYKEKLVAEEIFAEYLSGYLQVKKGTLTYQESVLVLENIAWVLNKYHSEYIVHLTDNLLAGKIDGSLLNSVIAYAVNLGSLFKESKKMNTAWNEVILSLKQSSCSNR